MTDITIPAAVAAASSVTLALFGVDYYSILWGFIGAMFALMEAEREPWARAVLSVMLSTLLGAAFGSLTQLLLDHPNRAVLIFGSLVGGAGSKIIVKAAIEAVVSRVRPVPVKEGE